MRLKSELAAELQPRSRLPRCPTPPCSCLVVVVMLSYNEQLLDDNVTRAGVSRDAGLQVGAVRPPGSKSRALRGGASLLGVIVGSIALAAAADAATDVRISRNGAFASTVALGGIGIASGGLTFVRI